MKMAATVRCGSVSGSWAKSGDNLLGKNVSKNSYKKGYRVSCVSSAAVRDPYKTLRIHRGASQSEVKKAFRQLALQYHPDVCRGSNSEVQFHQINEAYDIVMSNLRDEARTRKTEMWENYDAVDEAYEDRELWEEWMGWEGAGIRDYSSHINPYI